MNIFSLGYTLGLHLYAIGMLPKIVIEALSKGKYRTNFWARLLGKNFPEVIRDDRPLIWIHAVSVGETKAVAALVELLCKQAQVIISNSTETGHAEAKRSVKADYHVYLPFDLPYIIRPIVRRVRPNMLILVETDFWYHFQQEAKKQGAKLLLVNGKMSERSFHRFSKFPFLIGPILGGFDHYFVQGKIYYERFLKLKVPANKMTISGNLKLCPLKLESNLKKPPYFIITLGSTHDSEEKIWLDAIFDLPVKGYLAPRHPERLKQVIQLLEDKKISFGLWSQQACFDHCQVILIDLMGVLRRCYAISDLAFVGGSLTHKVGGHNLVEPCFFGVPVLYGPHVWGQPDLHQLIQDYKAGLQITPDTLKNTVQALIKDESKRLMMGSNGKKIFIDSADALTTVMLGVNKLLC